MLLNGWKEIAAHLGRGVRTVQRWESIGLPVRRPHAKVRSAVVADSDELDGWIRTASLRMTHLKYLRAENGVLRADCVRLRDEQEALRRELERAREQNARLRLQLEEGRAAVQRNLTAAATVKRSA